MTEDDLKARARKLARLSVAEIGAALRSTHAPAIIRSAIELLARRPSARLGSLLARFDARIDDVGLGRAAREVLGTFGAALEVTGSCPSEGSVLVITNHPGAYDALALMAALGRDDVALIAADRAFLRAMPRLSRHLVFVPDESISDNRPDGNARARARALRNALRWLGRGHVLVQFGAGDIEPDARFRIDPDQNKLLRTWSNGTGWLAGRAARACSMTSSSASLSSPIVVLPAFVSGVHSPRAKRLFFVRWAERRGITTIAPLVQATLPGFRDVIVSVKLGAPIDGAAIRRASGDGERASIVRGSALRLA